MNNKNMRFLAVDIGGTKIKYGIFEKELECAGEMSVTDKDGKEDIPKNMIDLISDIKPDVLAVSVPGPFDFKTGTGLMEHKLKSLYKVSLKEIFEKEFSKMHTFFIHDSVSFAYGALKEYPSLKKKKVAFVMLGTGLGYVYSDGENLLLNDKGTPLHSLWNRSYKDGICEDYISSKRLMIDTNMRFQSVKDIADEAHKGEEMFLGAFCNYASNLGIALNDANKLENFEYIVFGGQISKSWDLMKEGFEKECNIEYKLVKEPSVCALYGLKEYYEKRYIYE